MGNRWECRLEALIFPSASSGESHPPQNLRLVSSRDFRGRVPGDPWDLPCLWGKGNAAVPE